MIARARLQGRILGWLLKQHRFNDPSGERQ